MDISSFLAALAVMAAPLVLAALGETLTEKAGVVNLSLDGTILLGAMTGFVVASRSQSLLLGFLAAALTGCAVAALLAVIGVWLGQSQVAVGFALTFLCRDLAYFLGNPYARQQGPQLETLAIPFLTDIPFLGKVLFSHSPVVYASFLAIPCCIYFMHHTRHGLIVRAAGENPESCWARGMNPSTVRILATLAGGMLVGIAGAAFSLSVKPGWGHPQGCEGIGWIALALVIFGSWHPLRVAAGAYLFGLLQLLGITFQDLFPTLPAQIFQVAPFPLMIFTLILIHLSRYSKNRRFAGFIRLFGSPPPKWLGRPYRRS
jgi:simple sugar transport system permease protein